VDITLAWRPDDGPVGVLLPGAGVGVFGMFRVEGPVSDDVCCSKVLHSSLIGAEAIELVGTFAPEVVAVAEPRPEDTVTPVIPFKLLSATDDENMPPPAFGEVRLASGGSAWILEYPAASPCGKL